MTILLKTLALGAFVATTLSISATAASAQNRIIQHTGDAARACVNRRLCPAPLSGAIRAWDRAGWEMGNHLNSRQGRPTVPYPGTRR
ncbi:MAG: hypothetical protein JJU24_12135 [Natronohydrobacter sp.]|nr:hypothetical protein [Natronohydrobacter sp.]